MQDNKIATRDGNTISVFALFVLSAITAEI
jgi:hypothetical protein